MTAQRYQAIFDWFRARPAALRALGYAQKISVLGVYLVYGAVLAVTLWQRSGQFWRVLAVPAAVYVLGTLLRAAINRPRPYEALNFTPLFPKDTKGQSMPSRHCFSAAAIAGTAWYVLPPLGAVLAVAGGAAVVGAAGFGIYELATRAILKDLLPEGTAIPATRGELALLLWQNAGRPEPAALPAFADTADTETAKAAQWCTEQGLLTAEDGAFHPEQKVTKYRVIRVWKQAAAPQQ